jgi:hypothetical protein
MMRAPLQALLVGLCASAVAAAQPATLKHLAWFGEEFWGGNDHTLPTLPLTRKHANLIKSGVLANITSRWLHQKTPGLLLLQGCVLDPPNTSHTTCRRLIKRGNAGLTANWREYAAQIIRAVTPLAPSAPPPLGGAIAGVTLGPSHQQ